MIGTAATLDNFSGTLSIRAALRLSDRWEVMGVFVDEGDIGEFDDDDPDRPVLRVEKASELKTIDRGTVVIDVSAVHGLRHRCPSCGGRTRIKEWET